MEQRATDLMVDLETLSTRPNGVVLSVGAVGFRFYDDLDPSAWPTYYRVLEVQEQLARGRVVDWSTLRWWLEQGEEARKAVASAVRALVQPALQELRDWVQANTVGELTVRAWGNGADFDLVMLGSLYHEYGLQAPWRYHNHRCFRTLKFLRETTYKAAQNEVVHGGAHNALEDALWQARVASFITGEAA